MRHNYRISRAFRLSFQRLYFSAPVSCILSGGIGGLFTAGAFNQTTKRAATVYTERANVSRETVMTRCPVLRATIGPIFSCQDTHPDQAIGYPRARGQPAPEPSICYFHSFHLVLYTIYRGYTNINFLWLTCCVQMRLLLEKLMGKWKRPF